MENIRYDEGQKANKVGIITNILLTLIKLLAGFIAHSTAMIADAVESASDILTTIIVALGLKIATKPADPEHPYGHEKAEAISAKFVAGFLLIAGLAIGWKAVQHLITGDVEPPGALALYAAILTIIIKETLFQYTILTAKKINSTALKANAWHYRSDALTSIITLIGIGAARLGYAVADPIAALVGTMLILKMAYEIYARSISELMDSSASQEKVEAIRQIILSVPKVKGIDLLKTRRHGNMIYVDVDIVVDRHMSVLDGHNIADEVKNAVTSKIEDVKDVMVHVNPCHPTSPNSPCQNCDKSC
ncbi:cation diffusion facilitator family transporter [Caldicoprobacter guelmensis]|uniref:cation diffusion facilitator family transporter n=1 Tax=Caldicoprobacter guelmensis TaxID=1170224 RepID=UPI001956835C|nr:cation diffusion facilitator family transporter [Caldicoprobacter guelmensis]MBM7583247.1 cation diffusion facilitator family transporter [Caldicoprobacter guelmensis]